MPEENRKLRSILANLTREGIPDSTIKRLINEGEFAIERASLCAVNTSLSSLTHWILSSPFVGELPKGARRGAWEVTTDAMYYLINEIGVKLEENCNLKRADWDVKASKDTEVFELKTI